jgi:hypothetical protein
MNVGREALRHEWGENLGASIRVQEMGASLDICWVKGCYKKIKKCIPHWLTISKILEGGRKS